MRGVVGIGDNEFELSCSRPENCVPRSPSGRSLPLTASRKSGPSIVTTLRGFLGEPLLHFTVAGAILFAGYGWMNAAAPSKADAPVRIGQGEIGWLRETFSSQWRRDPSDEELKALVETLVREQLLAREAQELGLDRDDTIVRRRLAQKLTFLVEETTRIGDPDEVELQKYLAANAERYRSQPRISFRQVFYSLKRRADAAGDARAALGTISGRDIPDGDPLPLDASFSQVDPAAISSLFGPSFAESIASMAPGGWAGPVKSAYGVHLVIVTERTEGKPRPFDEIRQALLDDWRRQKAREASDSYIEKLRDKYGVVIDDTTPAGTGRTAAVAP
jgi:hypothetical protein